MKIKSIKTKRKSSAYLVSYILFAVTYCSFLLKDKKDIVSQEWHIAIYATLTVVFLCIGVMQEKSYIQYKKNHLILRDGKIKVKFHIHNLHSIRKLISFNDEDGSTELYLIFIEEDDDYQQYEHYIFYNEYNYTEINYLLDTLSDEFESLSFDGIEWEMEVV